MFFQFERRIFKIKKYKLIIYSVLLVLASYNFSIADSLRIVDGDTINLNGEKIRFSGIDAPESNYKGKEQTCLINETIIKCGKLSKEFLIKKIGTNKVTCKREEKPDQYNRILAECFVNGESLSKILVKNGYAFDYARYSKKKYAQDQEYAKTNKLGLWAIKFEYPWQWRKKNK